MQTQLDIIFTFLLLQLFYFDRQQRMSNTRIILKPVGKMNSAAKLERQKRRSLFQPTRQAHNYLEQIMPESLNEKKIEQKGDISNRGLLMSNSKQQKPEIKFKLIEDPRQSQFSYRKYIVVQKILLILSLFSFLVEVVNTEIYVLEITQVIPKQWEISKHVEMTCSFFTILLSLCMLLRYISLNELEIDQKKYYCLKSGHGIFYQIYRFLNNFNLLKYFFIEVFIILLHPVYFFHDYQIELFESYDQIYLKHRVNDLLSLLSLSRLYIIMRSMINLTIYSTPRAYRLCGQNRVQHSLIFSIKCLLKQEPVKIITLAFLLQQIILGFGLKLSQGNLIYNNSNLTNGTGFENYINCYWCIFITMATVGYGDYYPKTLPGRFVGLGAALSGIILSSLLIVSLSAYLTMQNNEQKSHLTLIRLNNQMKLKEEATEVLLETMRMTKYLSSQQKSTQEKIKQFFIMLKHKIDIVKFRTRKIKSMVNNNNIIEEMDRLFQVFQQGLRESFAFQVELKKELERLSNNCLIEKKMQTIFLTHNMQEIIAKKL